MNAVSLKRYLRTHVFAGVAAAGMAIASIGGIAYYARQALASEQPAEQANAASPSVEVVTIAPKEFRLWKEFSGRLRAVEFVEVRPRVSGTITQVLFEEGAIVKKGDPLYVIDPRPFEAAAADAKAALNSAVSQAKLAKIQLDRTSSLLKNGHVSKNVFDERRNDREVANAAIESAKARLKNAELELEYAHITAPVDGRVSRAEITVGNLVETGPNAPVLTTIVSSDKIYAEFDVDEQTYIKSVRQSQNKKMPVELVLPSDSSIVYKGEIYSFDNRLDTTSGTIRARAIFDNSDGALIPGMFATARLGAAAENASLLVPERAVGTDQSKKFVYVIDDKGEVAYREVQLGETVGANRIVLSGVNEGDKVLVNSLQRVRPGMKVTPVDVVNTQSADDQLSYNQPK